MLGLAFAFHILLEEHVFAIENGVGELRNPVAQNHHARLFRKEKVELDVAMAIDEEVDVGVGFHVLLGVLHEILLVFAHIHRFASLSMLHAAMLGPRQSEPQRPTWVQRTEQHLARTTVENATQEFETRVGIAQSIAVGKVEHAVVYLHCLGLCVHRHAAFVVQVAVGPDIVVAGKEVHFDAHIGEFGDFTKETRVAFGHHVAIFIPKIEHVAKQIDGARLRLYGVKESHQPPFLRAVVVYRPRAKVSIT